MDTKIRAFGGIGKKGEVMKLYTKIILAMIFIALLTGSISVILVSHLMQSVLEDEMIKRCISITKVISEPIIENVINNEVLPTREVLLKIVQRSKDIEFAYAVGFDGNMFVHSFKKGFPKDLTNEPHEIITKDVVKLHRYFMGEEPILTVGYPLIDGMLAHIHIGMNESNVHNQIRELRNSIMVVIVIITFLGIFLATFFSFRITAPIKQLANSMHAFGKGEKEEKIEFHGGGREVKELIQSFKQMITERKQAEESLRTSNQQLIASEQQLAASEQQLRAANQQLVGSEQQLRTANQQLEASDKQLIVSENQIMKDLEEKNTLLRELYHRTKNNMQVVSSMLRIQSNNLENRSQTDSSNIDFLQDSFEEVINKIKAMSLVHQKLYQSHDLSRINLKEYIKDLVRFLMISFEIKSENVILKLELEDVFVLIDSAIPLGLVLNEMISNVFKHGFPNSEKDEIFIRLYEEEDETINIHLSDNGIGISNDIDLEKVSSMGLQTVFDLMKFQLKGKVKYKIENGLKWDLSFKDDLHEERV